MSTLENQPAQDKQPQSKPDSKPDFGDVFAGGNAPYAAAREAGMKDVAILTSDVRLASLNQKPQDDSHKAIVDDTAAAINAAKNSEDFEREDGASQALVNCVKNVLDEAGPEAVDKLPAELNSLLKGKKITFEKLPEEAEKFLKQAARQEGREEPDFIRFARVTEGDRVVANIPIEMTTLPDAVAQAAGKLKKFDAKALSDMSNELNIRIERNAGQKDGVKKALDSFAEDVNKKLEKYPGKLTIEIVDDPELTKGLVKAALEGDKEPPTTVKHIRILDKSIQLDDKEKAEAQRTGQDPAKMLQKKQTLDDSIFVHPSPDSLRRRPKRVA